MIALSLAAALMASEGQSTVDVNVNNQTTPAHCGAIDAYYFGCSLAKSAEAKKREKERQEIGALMADGKCDDAERVALRDGDFDTAQRVKTLCPSSPPPAVTAASPAAQPTP